MIELGNFKTCTNMENGAKMEDNFKEYNSASIVTRIMRRFALGMRELILLVAVVAVVLVCLIFVTMFGVSKSQEQAAKADAIKGRLYDNTCFTKGCLDTISYTIDNMNLSVDPCDNFYEYACGNYRNKRPLDADNRDHRPLRDLFLKNKERLRTLIEAPVKRTTEWASERKLKHLFKSCMDDYTLEKLKGTPFIDKVLGPLGGWYVLGTWDSSSWDLNGALKKVQTDFWTDALWGPRVGVDWTDWKKRSIEIHPAGTGRYMSWFYYTDPESSKIREDYKKFMRRVANLIVRDSKVNMTAQAQADKVNQFVSDAMTVESHIARIASNTEWTDEPYHDTNKISLDELTRVTGGLIDWTQQMTHLFDDANVNGRTKVAVYNFGYLNHISDVINNITASARARTVHNYLIWRVLEIYVSDLSVEYNHADRQMVEDVFGYKDFRGRWRFCFYYSNYVMRDAMGSLFVADHFADQNRDKVTEITMTTKQALKNVLKTTPWFDQETRDYAEKKLDATTFKLGYPDYIVNRDKVDAIYDPVQINMTDWFGNILNMNKFHKIEWNRELREQEDRTKWYFKTFDTGMALFWYWNQVVVPAGLLQFPFYDFSMPHYYTFGAFGSILGRFLLHNVDEWGSRWAQDGELMKDDKWWTNATQTAYADVKKCAKDVYTNKTQGPVVDPDGKTVNIPVNPERVVTEAIGVTSGVHISYKSYQLWQNQKGLEMAAPSGIGLTNDQLFFIAFSQVYCYNTDNELLYRRLMRGYRLTGELRVNLAVSQLSEFSAAFQCNPTAKLNPPNKCSLY